MPLWGKSDQANNAPKYYIKDNDTAIGANLYGNTGTAKVDGITASEEATAHATHAGWVLYKFGTGSVSDLTINSGGADYTNSSVLTVSGGTTNATANVRTNANGVITSFINLVPGDGFSNVASVTVNITVGTSANVTPVLNGRAGRVTNEVLVATGSIS